MFERKWTFLNKNPVLLVHKPVDVLTWYCSQLSNKSLGQHLGKQLKKKWHHVVVTIGARCQNAVSQKTSCFYDYRLHFSLNHYYHLGDQNFELIIHSHVYDKTFGHLKARFVCKIILISVKSLKHRATYITFFGPIFVLFINQK